MFLPVLERSGAEVAQRRMSPPSIVEELEVFEQLGARGGPRGPSGVMDELDLQRREDALGHRVVPAIPPPTHAADDAVLREDPLVVTAGVLGKSRDNARPSPSFSATARLPVMGAAGDLGAMCTITGGYAAECRTLAASQSGWEAKSQGVDCEGADDQR